ncbi:MAG: ATP-binding protein [Candidatus Aenigmarchaeota archaeon]|nr:ATP-binding protein [Candidatus Aenigmarchaeota archaeon]
MEINDKEQLLKYTLAKLAEAPQLVKNQLEGKKGAFRCRRAYFRIEKYIDDFLMGEQLGNITKRLIILPGLRGVGKTTLVFQIYNYLKNKKNIEQDRILYFSTDELKAYLGKKILDVADAFIQEVHKTTPVYLEKELFIFVDEAHFDASWSETAKILFDKSKKIFMIFTGSSALNLELSVDAARRTTKEIVFPMNFSEYLTLSYEGWFPPKNMAESIRDLIFNGNNDTCIKIASSKENELSKQLLKIGKPIDKEWEDFVCFKGFPFALNMAQIEAHEKIFNMIDRIIEKDIFSIQSFNTETRNTISRILSFLALQSPGGTSDAKLSERLGVSPTLIRSILDVLEKTHLIFSIKPYGGAGKIVRKPWKYYFLSPSINSAIRFKLGAFDRNSRDMFGVLIENIVASYLIRMKETINLPTGIFYDSDDSGVDFIIQDMKENIIPIEVGSGKKDKGQIEKAIRKYKSKYGIIICECPKIKKEGNIIFLPFTTFSFV